MSDYELMSIQEDYVIFKDSKAIATFDNEYEALGLFVLDVLDKADRFKDYDNNYCKSMIAELKEDRNYYINECEELRRMYRDEKNMLKFYKSIVKFTHNGEIVVHDKEDGGE